MGTGKRAYNNGKKLNIFKVVIVILLIIAVVTAIVFLVKYIKNSSDDTKVEAKFIEEISDEKEKTIDEIVEEFGGEIEEKVKSDTYYVKKDEKEYTVYSDGEIVEGRIVLWDGTSQKPAVDEAGNINIYNASELKWVADQVISGEKNFSGVTITLRANIDLGARKNENGEWEGTVWTPIIGFLNDTDSEETDASETVDDSTIEFTQENLKRFAGVFDGNNFSIRGLYVNSSEKRYQGLFGYQTGVITGLTIKNSCILGENAIGAIVGLNGGTIQNCSIENVEVKGNEKVGGLARY